MAKKLGPGKCVHCLKDAEERNSDHVFPESWYPDSTPPNVEKWQIPSCIPCNTDYGKLEQDFLLKVGLCLDPFEPASASIVQKSLRSLKSLPPVATRETPGTAKRNDKNSSRRRYRATRFPITALSLVLVTAGRFPASE